MSSPVRPPRRLSLTRDFVRTNIATASACLIGFVVALLAIPKIERFFPADVTGWERARGMVVVMFVPFFLFAWALTAIIFVLLTHRVYTRLPDDELAAKSLLGNRRFSPLEKFFGAGSATVLATQSAGLAALIALVVAWSPGYRESTLMSVLALAAVVSSWLDVVYYYALHYLRLWAAGEPVELNLAPTEQPKFVDFLHYSISIATLLGGDMRFLTRRGRHAVATQALAAMAFNTIVLAITVALVVR